MAGFTKSGVVNQIADATPPQAQTPVEQETTEDKPTTNVPEEKTNAEVAKPMAEEKKETHTVPYSTFKAEKEKRQHTEELLKELQSQPVVNKISQPETEIEPEEVNNVENIINKKFKQLEIKEDAIRTASEPDYSTYREQVVDLLKTKPHLMPSEALKIIKADALEERVNSLQSNQVPEPKKPDVVIDTPRVARSAKDSTAEVSELITARDNNGKPLYSLKEIKQMINRRTS
jgi:hypothetical protein